MAEVKIEEQLEPAVEKAVEAEPEAKPKAKRATRKKATTTKSTTTKSTTGTAKKAPAKKTTTRKTAAAKKTPAKRTTRKSTKTAAASKATSEADDTPKIDELPAGDTATLNSVDAPAQEEVVASAESEAATIESEVAIIEEPVAEDESATAESDSSSETVAEVTSEAASEEPAEDKTEEATDSTPEAEAVAESADIPEAVAEAVAETEDTPGAVIEAVTETESVAETEVQAQASDSDSSDETSESTDVEVKDEGSENAEASAEPVEDASTEQANDSDSSDEASESTDVEVKADGSESTEDVEDASSKDGDADSEKDDGDIESDTLAAIVEQANTMAETMGRSESSSHSRDRRSDTRANPRYESKHDRVESPLGARTIVELEAMHLDELRDLARAMSVTGYTRLKKYDLVMRLLRANAELQGHIFGGGILETVQDGIGFLRSDHLLPGPEDVYVSQSQIRRFAMRTGDLVIGQVRPPKDTEKYFSLLKVEAVNGIDPEEGKRRTVFEKLTPIFPNEQFYLETKPNIISTRLIDLLSPIGRGQRGLIVSPPKAGKTTILKRIANGISANYPDLHLMVVLIGERPEEVTDMDRSVEAEVVSSTFDEPVQSHVRVAEMAMARAKRLVENQQDVVILLDSVTRLSRAYNLTVPASGRTLSGGIDPAALYPPKRFFGAARNIEEGGSLTIIATCLVDTGSRMDDVIYEEFKGTGNMELTLSRRLAERRIFPALDIEKSGTRAEEKLLGTETLAKVYTLRRMIDAMGGGHEALLPIVERMSRTRTNEDFLETLTKR